MDTQLLNSLLLAALGFFVTRILKKADDIDLATKSISIDIALIKNDRKLIWDKINQMELDLEQLKELIKSK